MATIAPPPHRHRQHGPAACLQPRPAPQTARWALTEMACLGWGLAEIGGVGKVLRGTTSSLSTEVSVMAIRTTRTIGNPGHSAKVTPQLMAPRCRQRALDNARHFSEFISAHRPSIARHSGVLQATRHVEQAGRPSCCACTAPTAPPPPAAAPARCLRPCRQQPPAGRPP